MIAVVEVNSLFVAKGSFLVDLNGEKTELMLLSILQEGSYALKPGS